MRPGGNTSVKRPNPGDTPGASNLVAPIAGVVSAAGAMVEEEVDPNRELLTIVDVGT